MWGLKTFGNYKDDQISPLKAIQNFPLDVPIAFITSNADIRVPSSCTNKLIEILKMRGHKKIHHLELHKSHHSIMSLQYTDEVIMYHSFVNKLYDTYCGKSTGTI